MLNWIIEVSLRHRKIVIALSAVVVFVGGTRAGRVTTDDAGAKAVVAKGTRATSRQDRENLMALLDQS